MPDILIRGMKMPVSCFGCPLIALQNDGGTHCRLTCTSCKLRKINDDCPLLELPEHGDLIDRSDVFAVVDESYEYGDIIKRKDFDENNIPAIVPAERRIT